MKNLAHALEPRPGAYPRILPAKDAKLVTRVSSNVSLIIKLWNLGRICHALLILYRMYRFAVHENLQQQLL